MIRIRQRELLLESKRPIREGTEIGSLPLTKQAAEVCQRKQSITDKINTPVEQILLPKKAQTTQSNKLKCQLTVYSCTTSRESQHRKK